MFELTVGRKKKQFHIVACSLGSGDENLIDYKEKKQLLVTEEVQRFRQDTKKCCTIPLKYQKAQTDPWFSFIDVLINI